MEPTSQQLKAETERTLSAVGPEQLEETAKRLRDLNTRIVGFIRQRPGTCLLGALALGFVVGKIASRR